MKPRVLCKDCWRAHDYSALRARCKRCEQNRGYISHELLEKKKHVTPGGVYVCKMHRDQPLDIHCGNCRALLSLDTEVSDGGIMAILGDNESGKSTFLYVLRYALGAGPTACVQIRQPVGDSDEKLKEAVINLDRRRMSRTKEGDATARNYAWELVSTRSSEESWIVAFHDAGGEMWKNLDKLSISAYPAFYRYLSLISSAILVIDGEHIPSENTHGRYSRKVQDAITTERAITSALRQRMGVERGPGKEPIRGAVVITKSDLLWNRRGCEIFREGSRATAAEIREQVRRVLAASGRQFLLEQLDAMELEDYFAVSALGEGGAACDIDDAQPERLLEPVLAVIGFNDSRA